VRTFDRHLGIFTTTEPHHHHHHSGLQHPNILGLHGVCLEPLAMVIDFMPDGPLDNFLADVNKRYNPSSRLIRVLT